MKKYINLDSLLISIMIFVIIWLFSIIPYKLIFLDPVAKAVGDFELTDLVFSQISPNIELDSNIVLVNIGFLNRKEIARQLKIINTFQPAVIGIDALFFENKSIYCDTLLAKEFRHCNNLVIGSQLRNYNDQLLRYDAYKVPPDLFLKCASTGYVNLPTKNQNEYKTMRLFSPYALSSDSSVTSFALKIVESYNPEALEVINKRQNEFEVINYKGNTQKFITVDIQAFNDPKPNMSFIKDKIVLMGFLGRSLAEKTLNDIYFTPLNKVYAGKSFPDMYGVTIHANIISTILDNHFINVMPSWVGGLLAFIICFANVVIVRFIRANIIDYYGGISKILIFLQTIFMLSAIIFTFLIFHYKIKLTLALVSILFVPSTILFYDQIFLPLYHSILNKIGIKF